MGVEVGGLHSDMAPVAMMPHLRTQGSDILPTIAIDLDCRKLESYVWNLHLRKQA